jgi:2-dehydropantoate 2-reductase
MKTAIVGAGAMGSLFGALLSEAGNDVWLYDVWQDHVDAINRNGLQVEREGDRRIIKLAATGDPQKIGHNDLVIVFVKSTQTKSAAEIARQLASKTGTVLTLQNGMGNADVIAEYVDPQRIIAGTTSHGATLLKAGSIRHAGSGPTTLGAWATSETGYQNAQQVADFFSAAGIETQAVEDVHSIVWNKLLINIGINAITALTGIKNGELLDLESTREISRAAVEEAMAVAGKIGVSINAEAVEHVLKVAQATAANRSSMGQDIDNQRQTEISTINGYIVQEADRLGLDVPVNRTLAALVETLQYHYQ